MANRWTELERLARLKAEGALTEAEFEAEKAQVMARPRGVPAMALLISLAVLAVVSGVAMWRLSRLAAPAPPPEAATEVPPPPPAPPVEPPAGPPTMEQAFALAFPNPLRRVGIGGQTANARFRARLLYPLAKDTYVLVSSGENLDDDAHAASGFYAISYFKAAPELHVEGRTFVGSGSFGGYGRPPELRVVTDLAAAPLLVVTNTFSGQGSTETSAHLVSLGPTSADVRAVALAIPIGFDDLGGPGTCAISGRLVAGSAGAIKVRYRGSYVGELVYRKTSAGYVAPEGVDLYTRCPEPPAPAEDTDATK